MRNIVSAIFGLCLLSTQAQASLRADVEDRSPHQVVAQAHALAAQNKYSPVIGLLTANLDRGVLHACGIAIDPYTILTVAHFASEVGDSGAMIFFDPKSEAGVTKTSYKGSKIFSHPNFKLNKAEPLFLNEGEDGEMELHGVKLTNLKDLTFETYRNTFPDKARVYQGPDLAVVKLDKPLPMKDYPEFLGPEIKLADAYGLTIGYSRIRVCHPVKPTQLVEAMAKGFNKHLIVSKVFEQDDGRARVLFGNYCSRLVEGAENFIPNPGMLKTEGVPMPGDSGAPFFVKVAGKEYLAGIFASIATCNHQPWPENTARDLIKDITQPIFPIWMDIRAYTDWIRAHMGKKKK